MGSTQNEGIDQRAAGRMPEQPRPLWTQGDKSRAARCLRALGWERYRERQGARLEWLYRKAE